MGEALSRGWTASCSKGTRPGDDSEWTTDLPRSLTFATSEPSLTEPSSTRAASFAGEFKEEVVQEVGSAMATAGMGMAEEVTDGIPAAMLASFDEGAMTSAFAELGDTVRELTEGCEFRVSLALPIEWMFRVSRNAGISFLRRRYNGTELGDVFERMTASQLNMVGRDVQRLLGQNRATATNGFRRLLSKIPIAMESNRDVDWADVASDAQRCRELAEQAYSTASNSQEKLVVTSLLCNCRQMEGEVERLSPGIVQVDLADYIKTLLEDSHIQSDLRGGQLGSLLGGTDARRERLRMLASILIHAERFAKVHGLPPLIFKLPEELRLSVHALQLCCGPLFPEETKENALTPDENFVLQALRQAETREVQTVHQIKLKHGADEIAVSPCGVGVAIASYGGNPGTGLLIKSLQPPEWVVDRVLCPHRLIEDGLVHETPQRGGPYIAMDSPSLCAERLISEVRQIVPLLNKSCYVYVHAVSGIVVFDRSWWKNTQTLEHQDGGWTSVSVCPQGRRVFAASTTGLLTTWDLEADTKHKQRVPEELCHSVQSVRVAPTGLRALLLWTSTMSILEVPTMQEIRRVSFSALRLSRVRFSWDGWWALVSMRGDSDMVTDEDLTLWDLRTGRELPLSSPLQHISGFTFMPTEAGIEFLVGTAEGDVIHCRVKDVQPHSEPQALRAEG